MDILGLIPARGGSKGIPGKNIIPVCGRPLIEYSIDIGNEAVRRGLLKSCIVSTDDEKIAKISRKAGGQVPFVRPAELATDTSKTIDVILHALSYLEDTGQTFEAVMLLQPVCPLRTVEEVNEIVALATRTGADSIISVYREDYVCDAVSYYLDKGLGVPLNPEHNKGKRRQEQRPRYVRNGTYYFSSTQLLREKRLIVSDIPTLFIMHKNRSINIDTPDDLELLEWMLCR